MVNISLFLDFDKTFIPIHTNGCPIFCERIDDIYIKNINKTINEILCICNKKNIKFDGLYIISRNTSKHIMEYLFDCFNLKEYKIKGIFGEYHKNDNQDSHIKCEYIHDIQSSDIYNSEIYNFDTNRLIFDNYLDKDKSIKNTHNKYKTYDNLKINNDIIYHDIVIADVWSHIKKNMVDILINKYNLDHVIFDDDVKTNCDMVSKNKKIILLNIANKYHGIFNYHDKIISRINNIINKI